MELNAGVLPQYRLSSFRRFEKGESHVSRICPDDVLVLVFDGVLRFSENSTPVETAKDEYYIQKSGLWQQGVVPSDSPQYFYIHFHGDFSPSSNAIPLSGHFDSAAFMPLFCRLEALEQDVTASLLEKTAVFYTILNALNQKNIKKSTKSELAEKLLDDLIQSSRSGLTIGTLSEKYHYSANYITRVFRSHYHITPYQYLLLLRLQKAHQLLLSSEKPIQQICDECGFTEYSVFYKQFVEKYHVSPSALRKSHRIL